MIKISQEVRQENKKDATVPIHSVILFLRDGDIGRRPKKTHQDQHHYRRKDSSIPRCLVYDPIFLMAVVTTVLLSLDKEDGMPMRFCFFECVHGVYLATKARRQQEYPVKELHFHPGTP